MLRLLGQEWRKASKVPLLDIRGTAAHVRFLRTRSGRGNRSSGAAATVAPSALHHQEQTQHDIRSIAKTRTNASVLSAPPVLLPAFIRVRDLAKLLKRPLDDVLKKVVTRANRKFHLTMGDTKCEFKNVKQIVLPFAMAQDVAHAFHQRVAYEDMEPQFTTTEPRKVKKNQSDRAVMQRNPVIAVMGHVDHGKTTLMDALRVNQRSIAKCEAHGITQKINICEAMISPDMHATFLDTPGHFHFFRMRNNAAQVADMILLLVAADEGVLLQTEESIGAIEETGIPAIACINKVDLNVSAQQIEQLKEDLRSFVALQTCPIVEISAKNALNLDVLRTAIWDHMSAPAMRRKLQVNIGQSTTVEGVVLESIVMKGRGTVLRVLLTNGILKKQQHFVAGMIHGVVRSLRDADGKDIDHAVPGKVVEVTYANKSGNVDAPNEFGFFVLPEARAKQVIDQRQMALDFEDSIISTGNDADSKIVENESNERKSNVDEESLNVPAQEETTEEDDDEINEADLVETKSIIVKADGAGSLTSIQDTVDEMAGISTVRIGIGNISQKDIDVAINSDCPIYGFNVKLHQRERKLAAARGVRVILRSTIHGLIEEISAFERGDK